MPLIILTGIPCSGKTTRAEELRKYFEEQGRDVIIISEQNEIAKAGFEKNNVYSEAAKEKHIRGCLKSEVVRLLSLRKLVILDALNYIKGFRYELYCASKANKCTQCTIHTEINREEARKRNKDRAEGEKHNDDVLEALIMRYEDPEAKNRWDQPYFLVFPEQNLDFEAISSCLFENKPPPPNQSTQNPPLSSTNFLYELDKITKDITDIIMQRKNMGIEGEIIIPGYKDLSIDISNVNLTKLMLLRRQYITYCKSHTPEISQIPNLFLHYLKTSLK
ncbi:protein KTI12 homolog [Agrilus planipennis]|uniref:Protein KTI12 homolog n=1 Tax=Agrilus planipennis TaxID=224129 RepID=A0A1W4WQC9_AGRPL|nr:protein KTI12 homolog [Agrilus planipennis]